jgi:FAD/FMN-containing dehydrogenase
MRLSPTLAVAAFAVSTAAQDTCEIVESQTSITSLRKLELDYTTAQTEYWSTGCGALMPSCIFEPETTEEVVAIVRALHETDENFAVKSGGHNPNNYFASIDGGPLISTKRLNEIILNQIDETVRVGPGNRWDDISAALDGTGYTAVGGRLGNVGVGGYLMGGTLVRMISE